MEKLITFSEQFECTECLVLGAPGADQGDGQIPETGDAPEAPAGNEPTRETEADGLEADPGWLTVSADLCQE